MLYNVCVDFVSGTCWVTLSYYIHRDMEKKERKKSARRLCGFVSSLIPRGYEFDVLIQLSELTPEDEKFLRPLVQ